MVSFSSLIVASAMATAALAVPFSTRSATNSKKGAAYNEASLVSLVSDASWAYNWGSARDGSLPSGVEFVPMLWGTDTSGWSSAVETALSSGSKHILGFNEPDNSGQSNIDPSTAATLYKQNITPYKGKAELVSPAVTNGGAPMGLTWMKSYLEACNGECGQTAMAIHWYADASDTSFENYTTQAYDLASSYGIEKIWITEFQITGVSDSEQASFISKVISWLDKQPFVERFSYFYVGNGYLTNGNSLSSVGSAYNTAQ